MFQYNISPVSWLDFIKSKELEELKKSHPDNKLDILINELYPEGFLIRNLKLRESSSNIYYIDGKFNTRCTIYTATNDEEKYTVRCRYDILRGFLDDEIYDLLVKLDTRYDTKFKLLDMNYTSDWKLCEDGLHLLR